MGDRPENISSGFHLCRYLQHREADNLCRRNSSAKHHMIFLIIKCYLLILQGKADLNDNITHGCHGAFQETCPDPKPKLEPGDILTTCENTLNSNVSLVQLLIFIVALFSFLSLGSLYRTIGDASKLTQIWVGTIFICLFWFLLFFFFLYKIWIFLCVGETM